jgi:alkylation response protein AidB-like acyl-CoA dehydrogenase
VLFDFDDDQYAFRDSVRAGLVQTATVASLRTAWDKPSTKPGQAWRELAQLGLFGVLVPEDLDGLGATPSDLALPLEECGYRNVPEPIVETAVLAPVVLGRWAEREDVATLLRGVARGDATLAAGLGASGLVPFAARADSVLAAVSGELHLVPAGRVAKVPVETMDPSLAVARCEFDVDATTLLSADPAVVAHACAVASTGTASVLVGLSQRMLDLTRAYVLERRQFGRPIGSFQAVKHRLADVAVSIEAARGLSWHAMYWLTEPEPLGVAAAAAKAAAGVAARAASSAALQLHGGIGFTWEHDPHLWMQRAKALEVLHGTSAEHRRVLGLHVIEARERRLANERDRTTA